MVTGYGSSRRPSGTPGGPGAGTAPAGTTHTAKATPLNSLVGAVFTNGPDGETPNGVRPLGTVTVDPSWRSSGDQDLDVALAIVQAQSGRQVQVLGANRLGTDPATG
ncbi:hypothetical protein [Kitasatospora terrestris]|uniref:Uncharacterized protein n=1 Tax=Kitasatospora terrestris TaxID=258051 RepID=A0ABP9DIR8_9ACTN